MGKHHLSATQNSANSDLSRSVLAELVHDLPSHLHACTHSIGTSLCWQSGLAYIQKTEEREYSSLIDNQRPSILAQTSGPDFSAHLIPSSFHAFITCRSGFLSRNLSTWHRCKSTF